MIVAIRKYRASQVSQVSPRAFCIRIRTRIRTRNIAGGLADYSTDAGSFR